MVLFAEGTTGDGRAVLPFRSSLFAAGVGHKMVRPVALVWSRRDGRPFDPRERRRFAWIDDDRLLPHAIALALSGGARVDLHFEPALSGEDRKQLAAQCRAAIARRVAEAQAATLKRAA
ncbi:MAG: hypothetical protein KGM18_06430 [Sphingomonadales bacterium]|nr:hypothetical protein [Sphingomonadales bacterium]